MTITPNFYYCRYDLQAIAGNGYKPNIISTIVDACLRPAYAWGYKPNIISTIVDDHIHLLLTLGYKPNIISTIVDD